MFKTDDGQLVAHSLIEKLYGGCAIRENWFPLQGSGGGSLNVFRPATQSWHQTWVDSGNNINEYSGGMVGRKLVLTGTASDLQDRVQRVRMTLEPIVDGRVLQTGFNWSEADKSWALSYQLEYRPQAAPPQ